jgi:ubiquinone/menaquinone biosynthesis C-methylase UbiE
MVVDGLDLRKGMRVPDLGCGTGWATLEIASRLEGRGRVVGLDVSEGMVEQANEKLPGFRYDNAEFQVGSANSLDYVDRFDLAINTNAFHHYDDRAAIFGRVLHPLRPGGMFVVRDFCRDYFLMRMLDTAGRIGDRAHVGTIRSSELRDLLSDAGFQHVRVEISRLAWPWGIAIGRGTKEAAQ